MPLSTKRAFRAKKEICLPWRWLHGWLVSKNGLDPPQPICERLRPKCWLLQKSPFSKLIKLHIFHFICTFKSFFFSFIFFFMSTSEFLMHLFLICSQQHSRWTLLLKAAEVLTHLNFCKELLFCKIVQSVHSCGLQIRNAEGTEYTHTSGPLWTLPSADSDSREYTSSVRISTRCERALRKRGTAEEQYVNREWD